MGGPGKPNPSSFIFFGSCTYPKWKSPYQVDKEIEGAITELRRSLPKFWGRRVAKALKVQLRADVPLEGLAKAMADTASWSAKPPDFYALALVPFLVAAGAE